MQRCIHFNHYCFDNSVQFSLIFLYPYTNIRFDAVKTVITRETHIVCLLSLCDGNKMQTSTKMENWKNNMWSLMLLYLWPMWFTRETIEMCQRAQTNTQLRPETFFHMNDCRKIQQHFGRHSSLAWLTTTHDEHTCLRCMREASLVWRLSDKITYE